MTDTEDHRAAVLAELNGTVPFQAASYYGPVELAGTPVVDIVVSAVNHACEAANHTEDWVTVGAIDRIDAAVEVAVEQYRELEAALARVRALHSMPEDHPYCKVCFVTAPCATVRAIDEVGGME